MAMKIMLTGGAGRVGRLMIGELLDHGHEVVAIDRVPIPDCACQSSVIDLLQPQELAGAFAGADAVIHLARKKFPYTSSGFNAPSRSWKTPDPLGDAAIFSYNVSISYNVVAAVFAAGVKKLVMGSSLTIYGFYYPSRWSAPAYLPVDEDYPLKPQDPYSISKLVVERACDGFASKSDMQIASLRFAGVCADFTHQNLRQRRNDPLRWSGPLWTYIDVRDAAIACRLAVEANFTGHEPFNICAPTTLMERPTVDLAKEYLPGTKLPRDRAGNWAGYDCVKAQRLLGFSARYRLE
jgi:nucleoside-diphosphate-sugar epimerase